VLLENGQPIRDGMRILLRYIASIVLPLWRFCIISANDSFT
jgi:hypothetical protein